MKYKIMDFIIFILENGTNYSHTENATGIS